MRILVFSDTHFKTALAERAIHRILGVDLVIHLGDMEQDARHLRAQFPELRIESVPGNGDFSSRSVPERLIELDGHRVFFTHGHLYGVKRGLDTLEDAARAREAELVLFGHTHRSIVRHTDGLIMMNPGSAGAMFGATCGIIETDGDRLRCDILPLSE